jgi:hypothetical protein
MKNDGGPAFPTWDGPELVVQGMSLRDYFAAKAMEAMINNVYYQHLDWDKTSIIAYSYSDAMIKARELEDEV